jgi:hypothetical protein
MCCAGLGRADCLPPVCCCSNPYVKSGSKAVGVKNYADATATMGDPAVLAMMANWGRRRAVGRPSVPTAIRVRVRTPTLQRQAADG